MNIKKPSKIIFLKDRNEKLNINNKEVEIKGIFKNGDIIISS